MSSVTVVKPATLSRTDMSTGLLSGETWWRRIREQPVTSPMISPPASASQSIGRYAIESAALYSAAMGVSDIAKVADQNANPPPMVSRVRVLQFPRDRVIADPASRSRRRPERRIGRRLGPAEGEQPSSVT